MDVESVALGPFVLDRRRRQLTREGKVVPIGHRGYVLLETLLDAQGAPVDKATLMERAWPGIVVEEGNLTTQIATLRKQLGAGTESLIVTVPRVGYRLVAATAVPEGRVSGRPSIAVLPFVNLSSEVEHDHIGDGLVEDLITGLSRFKTFAVVSRTSSFAYKGRSVDAREAARDLGVRYLLEGSVRRSGQRVRITAQLIDGGSGAHHWAETFDGAVTDIFDFQDLITRRVIGLIEPQLRKAEISRARQKRPESMDAWDLYVQALPLVYSTSASNHTNAIALLDRAIAIEPDYAPALALAAWAREKRRSVGGVHEINDVEDSLGLAQRAFDIDPDDPMVMGLLGFLRISFRRDYSGLDLCNRAVALNPNNILVLNFATVAHSLAGDLDEMIACATRALELSPGSPDTYVCLHDIACGHVMAGRFEDALYWARRSIAINNSYAFAHLDVAVANAHLGRVDEAREAIVRVLELRPDLTTASLVGNNPNRYKEREIVWTTGQSIAGLPAS